MFTISYCVERLSSFLTLPEEQALLATKGYRAEYSGGEQCVKHGSESKRYFKNLLDMHFNN